MGTIDCWPDNWRKTKTGSPLKIYMDTMSESYLRETMEGLIPLESPRLYHEYWTACPAAEEEDDAPPPNDPAFAKTGVGS